MQKPHAKYIFGDKKILFIGPSKVALEDFDWAILDHYDYIARTNMFLENRDVSKQHNRCDIIYLNVHSVHMYLKKLDKSKLKNTIILVKRNRDVKRMRDQGCQGTHPLCKHPKVYSAEHVINSINKQLRAAACYSGTALIVYLAQFCNQLDVCGLDFYQSGFGLNAKHIEGYNAYNNGSSKEEHKHKMQEDIKFLRKFLSRNKHVNFIHKTKTIFQEL